MPASWEAGQNRGPGKPKSIAGWACTAGSCLARLPGCLWVRWEAHLGWVLEWQRCQDALPRTKTWWGCDGAVQPRELGSACVRAAPLGGTSPPAPLHMHVWLQGAGSRRGGGRGFFNLGPGLIHKKESSVFGSCSGLVRAEGFPKGAKLALVFSLSPPPQAFARKKQRWKLMGMEKETAPWPHEGKRHTGISLWALLLWSALQSRPPAGPMPWESSRFKAQPRWGPFAVTRAVGELSFSSRLLCQRQRGEEQPRWESALGMHRHRCAERWERGLGRCGSCTSYCFLTSYSTQQCPTSSPSAHFECPANAM